MKKIFALILAIAMLVMSVSALAEGNENQNTGTEQTQTVEGTQQGAPMGQPPMGAMNGQMGGRPPMGGMNGQMDGNRQGMRGQPPMGEKPENAPEKPTGEKPADAPEEPEDLSESAAENQNARNGNRRAQGRGFGGMRGQGSQDMKAHVMIDFDAMVTNGVISQETCDKIKAFMEEHKPEDLPEMHGKKPENLPEMNGGRSGDMPEMNGQKPAEGGLLAELLENNVITQEEYDALTAAL